MWKIIIFLVLTLALPSIAKEVWGVGKVKTYYRAGNFWTGTPTMAYIEVVNDYEYVYYIVPDAESPLLNYMDRWIKFSGRAYKDSTTLKDGGLPHWFIKNILFEPRR